MGNKRIRLFGTMCCFTLLFLTGCWDRVEIEDRGFVVAVAVDKVKNEDLINLTLQLALPTSMQGAGKSGSGSDKGFLNITQEGRTVPDCTRAIANRISRTPYFEHSRLIVISQEIAETPNMLGDIVDVFVRDKEMRRGTKLFVSSGSAKEILDIETPVESLPAKYIDSISENIRKSSEMAPPMRIGEVQEHLLKKDSFAVQKVENNKEEVKIAGLAVLIGNNGTLAGYLEPEETKARNLITGDVNDGLLEVKIDDKLVVVEFFKANRRVKVTATSEEHIRYDLHINLDVLGTQLYKQLNPDNPVDVRELEAKLGKEVERIVMNVVQKSQTELKSDIFEFGQRLKIKKYRLWEKIKKDWDSGENYFSKCEVNVVAEVGIENFQAIRNTYKE